MKLISAGELRRKIEASAKFTLLDARGEASYRAGHIKGAVSLPLDEIEKAEGMFRKDEEIVVYCGSYECLASDKASRRLSEMGFTNVTRYEGGMKEWRGLGFPTES